MKNSLEKNKKVKHHYEDYDTESIKSFWQASPLCTQINPFNPGSKEFFELYNNQREEIESLECSYKIHEYLNFKDKKVLDVGCGNGYVLSKYATEGADVHGVDLTQAAIDLTCKRFENLNLNGNFRVADAQALPFSDDTFDCVCSMGVLHHVPNTQKAVDEIFRVLKPGGRLIVMFYHRNSAKYQFNYRVRSLFSGKSLQQLANEFDGIGNPKGAVFSKSELAAVLNKFSKIRMNIDYLSPGDIIPFGGRFLPSNMFKPVASVFGWNLYAKGNKPI
jgi:ubiquinone/menaquinone biosynthesis C-methylase UbiE